MERKEETLKAIVLVRDIAKARRLADALALRGMDAQVSTDPETVLRECLSDAPHLAIVEDSLGTITGVRFLASLLKVSWTTSTILICDEPEETVHEKTEGLGLLGSIRSSEDTVGLNALLDRFFEIHRNTHAAGLQHNEPWK